MHKRTFFNNTPFIPAAPFFIMPLSYEHWYHYMVLLRLRYRLARRAARRATRRAARRAARRGRHEHTNGKHHVITLQANTTTYECARGMASRAPSGAASTCIGPPWGALWRAMVVIWSPDIDGRAP